MSINRTVLITALSLCIFSGVAFGDNGTVEKLGIEKQTTDAAKISTDIYRKELGKTDNGKGFGVYGSSTEEHKKNNKLNSSANENEGTDAKGAGIYIEY